MTLGAHKEKLHTQDSCQVALFIPSPDLSQASIEAADKTSSLILLSRAVADLGSDLESPFHSQDSDCMAETHIVPSGATTGTTPTSETTEAVERAARLSSPGEDVVALENEIDVVADLHTEAPADTNPAGITVSTPDVGPSLFTESARSADNAQHGFSMVQNDLTHASQNGHPHSQAQQTHLGTLNEDRGRPLHRVATLPNPLSRAHSRNSRSHVPIEITARPILKRPRRSSTLHDDPRSASAILDDALLEPLAGLSSDHTMEEVLGIQGDRVVGRGCKRVGFKRSKTDVEEAAGAKADRGAHIGWSQLAVLTQENIGSKSPPPISSSSFHKRVDHYPSDYHDVTKTLSLPGSNHRSRCNSKAASLATEIIQQIYHQLAPTDFNNARHTCRAWFASSLEKGILEVMLRRGGWYAAFAHDAIVHHGSPHSNGKDEEWLMSRRIARECILGPYWRGNGIAKDKSSFVQIASVEFTETSSHATGGRTPSCLFIFSACGKFLIVASGCIVRLYELNRSSRSRDGAFATDPGSIRPVTTVICPRRVIACSMDTSSHRYALAILMDGRLGMVCDIALDKLVPPTRPSTRSTTPASFIATKDKGKGKLDEVPSLMHVSLKASSSDRCLTSMPVCHPSGVADPVATLNDEEPSWQEVLSLYTRQSGDVGSRSSLHSKRHCITPGGRLKSIAPSTDDHEHLQRHMPVEDGPRSLYHNLCSEDDPPRSIAICPQRRCVAFGCSAGIELHWVDALTGQDLNRWFPLTSPSDYLYFLPPRRSVDSAKKLRLISSAARPSERPAAMEKAFGTSGAASPFWTVHSGAAAQDAGTQSVTALLLTLKSQMSSYRSQILRDASDHYRAVPLSDGHHVIFTDPATESLCLGSDAPVGGPTKLLRKIWFQSPEHGRPVLYAVGNDLSSGVRVVAAYGCGDRAEIWFYSVPIDVFHSNRSTYGTVFGSRAPGDSHWVDWWPEDGWQDRGDPSGEPPSNLSRRIWPVRVRGCKVGTVSGLVDLTVDSSAMMSIWAVDKYGRATAWKVNDGADHEVKEICLAVDGSLRRSDDDDDGGEEMLQRLDADSPHYMSHGQTSGGYDGAIGGIDHSAVQRSFARRLRSEEGAAVNQPYSSDGESNSGRGEEANTPDNPDQERKARCSADFWAKHCASEASFRGHIATVDEAIYDEEELVIARIDVEIR